MIIENHLTSVTSFKIYYSTDRPNQKTFTSKLVIPISTHEKYLLRKSSFSPKYLVPSSTLLIGELGFIYNKLAISFLFKGGPFPCTITRL
jgi:hypothetical protein